LPPAADSAETKEKRAHLLAELRAEGITDSRVLDAMERTPRELFVPAAFREQAYDNVALPIGHGQTISQPYIVALMTQALEVGERDNGATTGSAGFHNWLIANIHMANVLKAKGYHYRFVYAVGAGHVDRRVVAQTLPQALEWLWKGYKPENWQAASNSPTSKRTALTTSETDAATWGESSRHIGLIVSTEIANR